MDKNFYSQLTQKALLDESLTKDEAIAILSSEKIDLLPLLNSAYEVRKKFFDKKITLHVINNVQNGQCSEDCKYCVQSTEAKGSINEYPMKSDEQIMDEAKQAYERGAHRYCMVYSGRSLSGEKTEHLSQLIQKIKSAYPIQVCVSHGFLNKENAEILKKSGLDRLNHNINTSNRFYSDICTTHDYKNRIQTLQDAHEANLEVCSGVIIGMGETAEDIYDMACSLRKLKAESIPVNFYLPINGTSLDIIPDLSPEYCLRVLCLFRLINPNAEIRLAAGREIYLKDMQTFAFYPANSLFINGYLNTDGESPLETYERIKRSGFSIVSNISLDELIDRERQREQKEALNSNEMKAYNQKDRKGLIPARANENTPEAEIPQYIIRFITQKKYIGRMNDPDGSAFIKGPCGDEMEFYLTIKDNCLKDIKFNTNGCFFTYACGTMVAHLTVGKRIKDVLQISPGLIIKELRFLPKDHCHCAILAVSTLYKAIADYWLKD